MTAVGRAAADERTTPMALILVTGAATGLGLAAAQALTEDGHEVVVHARGARSAECGPRRVGSDGRGECRLRCGPECRSREAKCRSVAQAGSVRFS